ncbi:TPA: hypothetical protein HA251_04075 [Candidatus Woesearchaeota archaeon]|nr:hypothetical protein [Candidatus Woesearchaeota archaeon]
MYEMSFPGYPKIAYCRRVDNVKDIPSMLVDWRDVARSDPLMDDFVKHLPSSQKYFSMIDTLLRTPCRLPRSWLAFLLFDQDRERERNGAVMLLHWRRRYEYEGLSPIVMQVSSVNFNDDNTDGMSCGLYIEGPDTSGDVGGSINYAGVGSGRIARIVCHNHAAAEYLRGR